MAQLTSYSSLVFHNSHTITQDNKTAISLDQALSSSPFSKQLKQEDSSLNSPPEGHEKAILFMILLIPCFLALIFYVTNKFFFKQKINCFNTTHLKAHVKHAFPGYLQFKKPSAIQSEIDASYFEIQIVELPKGASVAIGLGPSFHRPSSLKESQLNILKSAAFGMGSISLEVNLSQVHVDNHPCKQLSFTFTKGDIIGCQLLNFPERVVIFSKNGIPSNPIKFTGHGRQLRALIFATPGTELVYNLEGCPASIVSIDQPRLMTIPSF
ncbi:hypothetical protein DSO57_1026942 [Entomophthora muscae]|uniref:Uncharacterized protein n=1 Tax=Entomophthora muscae TaxID=34485 RepID=A0ACC2T1Y4_9FUNG|nr:hypothetical protein DSO57_1026942 [Entomophthora muscae]